MDYGYPYNNPLAAPEEHIPARVIPSPAETRRFVNDFADGVQQGVEMLREDSSSTISTEQATTKENEPAPEPAPVVKKKPLRSLKESLNFTPKPARDEGSPRQRGPLVRTTMETIGQIAKRLQREPADRAFEPASEITGDE